MQFENQNIPIDELPIIKEEDFSPLEANFKTFLFIRNSIFFIVLLIGVLLFQYFSKIPDSQWGFTVLYIVIIVFWIISMAVVYIGFKYKGYILRKHDVVYKSGFIFQQKTIIPKNRIQHIEIRQGIMLRMFGLSKLVLYTAGGSTSDLSISGLKPDISNAMKEEISRKIADNG
ncbi:MAG: PH domain-containing protein [Bacteroidales bacterium]|nr:PH domain-containing protein [Bacteroidales bacterium]